MSVPEQPKIYHIVHVDRLPSIIGDGYLWADGKIQAQSKTGTTIGMDKIKHRRLNELQLSSHPGLYVGQCVPFYFCPRSVMLYIIHKANHPDLAYTGRQGPIIHLEADLLKTVSWADEHNKHWAFTLTNAGSRCFEDRANLNDLKELDWTAINAMDWENMKEGKQAEFLVEESFPWELVDRVGVQSSQVKNKINSMTATVNHRPSVTIMKSWYY